MGRELLRQCQKWIDDPLSLIVTFNNSLLSNHNMRKQKLLRTVGSPYTNIDVSIIIHNICSLVFDNPWDQR